MNKAAPFNQGDWVAGVDTERPTIGMVKDCGLDAIGWYIDIVVYRHDGQKIGRDSPPEGGPTSFEPACPAERYRKIQKPQFPLRLTITRAYNHSLIWM
jgi:hypothetical protein